ncbi:MAG: alanine racemase, partial [Bacteroidetes bacterium]
MTDIATPTVLLNWPVAKANIDRMVDKARRHGLRLRPHLKTAQCLEIARYFEAKGVGQFTCSSFSMARYFAEGGIKDITVAFPVNLREAEAINSLASQISLNVLVVNAESLAQLKKDLRHPLGVFVKIDVGTHRTGLLPEDETGIEACLREMESNDLLTFKGFLAHAGHSYAARSSEEILKVHRESTAILLMLKSKYQSRFPSLEVSTGDTPTCSVADDGWEGIDEIRPGNFVFYDLMQVAIGSCRME